MSGPDSNYRASLSYLTTGFGSLKEHVLSLPYIPSGRSPGSHSCNPSPYSCRLAKEKHTQDLAVLIKDEAIVNR